MPRAVEVVDRLPDRRVEQAVALPRQGGGRAGRAVGRGDGPRELLRRAGPVQLEGGTAQQGQLARPGHLALQEGGVRGGLAGRDLAEHLVDARHRRVGDEPVVQGALGDRRRRHRERRRRPHRPGVHLLDRGQRGHAPPLTTVQDGVVEGRRAAVAHGPGVHDDGGPPVPDLARDAVLEERRQDEVRGDLLDAPGEVLRRIERGRQLDADVIPPVHQMGPHALCEPVERRDEQQDPHANPQSGPGATMAPAAEHLTASRGDQATVALIRRPVEVSPGAAARPSSPPGRAAAPRSPRAAPARCRWRPSGGPSARGSSRRRACARRRRAGC